MEGVTKTKPGSSQWCPVPGQESMGTKLNTGNSYQI